MFTSHWDFKKSTTTVHCKRFQGTYINANIFISSISITIFSKMICHLLDQMFTMTDHKKSIFSSWLNFKRKLPLEFITFLLGTFLVTYVCTVGDEDLRWGTDSARSLFRKLFKRISEDCKLVVANFFKLAICLVTKKIDVLRL